MQSQGSNLEDPRTVLALGETMTVALNTNITSGLLLNREDIRHAGRDTLESWKHLILREIDECEADVFRLLCGDSADEKEDSMTGKCNIPEDCVPIRADVRTFDFLELRASQIRHGGRLFDVIMMDPPWKLGSSNPSRGVAIEYPKLTDHEIKAVPIPQLQENGFLFLWVINSKLETGLEMLEFWGYKYASLRLLV